MVMATGAQQGDDLAQANWTAVDRYIAGLLLPEDPILDAALDASRAAELPLINVSPTQGKLLHLLARIQRARSILELGTLGGYSTIWLARAFNHVGSQPETRRGYAREYCARRLGQLGRSSPRISARLAQADGRQRRRSIRFHIP